MTELMQQWEGVSLPGDLSLGRWLGGDENTSCFQASLNGRPALVKIIHESAATASQLDFWQRIRQLSHPNLLELIDCGRADVFGESILYAAFESPDDTLASALAHSALSPQEAREVLDSVLVGLRYAHENTCVIGAIDPEHIVAVGDRIKLSTDAARPAPDPAAYAEDIRRFGEFWRQALMPASPKSAEIAAHAVDPDPQTRWRLDQISAALAARVITPAVLPPPVQRRSDEPAVPYHFPKWIIVGAAGVLLLILGLNLRRPSEVATQPPTKTVSVPLPAPSSAPLAAPPAAPREPKPSPIPAKERARENWRVIAFTYKTREAASKKVQQINQHHPDLHATIFLPKGKGLYLVALGGPMTHEAAIRIQHTARGKGLPRDLYVQNYER